ncbi:hypothetical protein KIW84_034942 [Lathyrus oleraceus]|uniref:CCHC-type domain-containing protein n=1 Tax=Pisum sativum TaxID=3888 RepID=A0A9D5B515_PEA|nr:hypothetical protein KIW84_034942 [Pisum sativum]
MYKYLPELLAMLRTAEQNLKSKGKSILMIRNGKRQNKRPTKQGDKGKGKEVSKPKLIIAALKPSEGIKKEGTCFHCGKTGHLKRNCPKYLEDKKNGVETSTSGIFVIEINLSTSASWVLDTGCGSHICTNVKGLKMSRDLAKGEVYLRVGNGAKVVALAVGTYLEPKSDKCLFVGYPKETRGYYFYNPSEGKVFVARTRVFLEKDFISKGISGRKVELKEIQESPSIDTLMEELEQGTQVVVEEQPAQVEQDQRRSSRIRHLPK